VPHGTGGQALLVSLPIHRGARVPATVEPQNGWHWREWLTEGTGSGIVLFAVVTAKDLAVRAGPPFSHPRWCIATTMGLWLQRTVSSSDLAGYWAAQLTAAGLECAATAVQLTVVFALLASRRYHRWTPLVAAFMLTIGIIALGPVSGGAFNPVRGLAPDLLAGTYPAVWIYIAGPLLGAVLAAAALAAVRRRPITGKLRHDPAIPSYMRSDLRLLEQKVADVEIRAARRRRDQPAR
jgi:aquaporin Z